MDALSIYGYVILFAPIAATLLITCFTLRSKAVSAGLAVAGMGAALVANILAALQVFGAETGFVHVHEITWLSVGDVTLTFGVQLDALSTLMCLVVTVIGSCIFVFSTGYMKGEEGYSRYFACLSLFAFSMLGIVLSTNLVQTFIFWELVGVSSYALIGYYYHKDSAVDAGKKAFLTNRIGDFGMTWGIILLFYSIADTLGFESASFSFVELRAIYESDLLGQVMAAHPGTMMWASLLIFTGALAKSAQVPLHVWLPDAMEGPTPVSALMHAATMVAAGVFLVSRLFFMFAPFPDALAVVAWIGGVTAILAAAVAFVQHDIKKVLAYSTLSQLGYMVMALGLGSPVAAMFHLTTHACFKALLFLGSGSVIHGCHHEQDMRQMGGLFSKMKITAITFWVGTLALAGIFPLSGFWSKDAILGAASVNHLHVPGAMVLYGMGVLVAFMTAAYMGRCCLLTFHGKYRGHAHPHESPLSMTGPLMILAVLAVVAGAINLPGSHWLESSLMGTEAAPSWFAHFEPEEFHMSVAIGGTLAAVLGLVVAWLFYGSRKLRIDSFVRTIRPLHTLLVKKYYFDEIYLWIVREIQQRVAIVCDFVEVKILRLIVDAVAGIHVWFGAQIRLLLDGHLHRYVTLALLGVVVIVAAVLVGN